MAINTTWTNPTTAVSSGGIDFATGNTIDEASLDRLVSNLYRLGGADGNTKTGNYGIGVAPSANLWASTVALQAGTTAGTVLADSANGSMVLFNSVESGSNAYKAIATGLAARLKHLSGTVVLSLAPSVAAGSAQTFTDYLQVGLAGGTAPYIYLIGAPGIGSGSGVVGIGDCTTAPTTNPSGGGILYAQAGALKWRGSGGTVTTLGAA